MSPLPPVNESGRQTRASTRGNNLDSVRRHNLSLVLGIAHAAGSVSRAQVTRETGLNRSTVAALVGELSELGLLVETGPEVEGRVGRPSPLIAPHPGVTAFAVNPEVDAVTVGLVGLDGTVRGRVRKGTGHVPTPEEAVELAAAGIEELWDGAPTSRVAGIGAAIPGLVQQSDRLVRRAPHLGWVDVPFAGLLAKRTGLAVFAANDAQLGAYAEHSFGAGRGVGDLLYVNGGASGIGGGIISDGVALAGANGYAGEIGHVPLLRDPGDGAGTAAATLESEVSLSALLPLLELGAVGPDEFQQALLASRDGAVMAEARRQLRVLGAALGGAITLLNPRLVVLGGFLAALLAFDTELLTASVGRAALPESVRDVRIERTALGADILLIGAAELAFAALIADPSAGLASHA